MSWDTLWPTLGAIAVILAVVPIMGLYMTFIERKLAAYVQDRVGPNRVGPLGLLQAVADGIKIFLKEQVIPDHVHKSVYFFAPVISLIVAMLALVVVPYGPVDVGQEGGFRFIVMPGIDVALMLFFAISSLSAYGIILGGWASNNKYSLYGGIRSCAQFISYEIPLGLSVLGVVAFTGSLNIEKIVAAQSHWMDWNIWWQPLAGLVFFTAALAETNRLPFDLPECEQELVGGFHTEYSGIKFVLFFLAEYTHITTVSFMTVLLFFGGWHFPGLETTSTTIATTALHLLVLLAKVSAVIVFIMLLRWALPRFRYDQLMRLAWVGLIPLALGNIFAVLVVFSFDLSRWWAFGSSILLIVIAGIIRASAWKPIPAARSPAQRLSVQGVQ